MSLHVTVRRHSVIAAMLEERASRGVDWGQCRSNRVCKACSVRRPIGVAGGGGLDEPCMGKRDAALLECLHTGRSNLATPLTGVRMQELATSTDIQP